MKHPPSISDAEWQVMEALWLRSPLTAAEVISALSEETTWKPNTVRTLLARLVQKGALKTEEDGNRYLYRPVFAREEFVSNESETFLERVFKGSAEPLLLHFAEKSRLSKEQVAKLRKLLEE